MVRFILLIAVILGQFGSAQAQSFRSHRFKLLQLKADVVSFWRLEEASGTRSDEIGGNDLADNNTVTNTTGVIGNAALFTRANSEYLTVTDASLSLTRYSVMFWFNGTDPSDLDHYEQIFAKETAASNDFHNYEFSWNHQNSIYIRTFLQYDGTDYQPAQIATSLSDDVWYNVTGTYDGVNVAVYLNGELEDTQASDDPNIGTFTFYMGAGSTNDTAEAFFNGAVDAFLIVGRVMTDYERRTLYNHGNGMEYYAGLGSFSNWH